MEHWLSEIKWQPDVFLGLLPLSGFLQDVGKASLWDVKEGLMRRGAAGIIVERHTYTHMPMTGMCLELAVEHWGWLSEDDRDESQGEGCRALPRSLGYEHPKALFCSWYKSHFGHCGKWVLVTKYSWKELNEKKLTLGLTFGGFCPWLADGFFLDHGEVDHCEFFLDHCDWRVQKNWVAHFMVAKKPDQTEPPSFNHHLWLDRPAETQGCTTQSSGVCFLPKWKQEKGCWSRSLVSL